MRVLIADDNFQIRQLLKFLLRDLAEEVYECADGSAALSLYREHRPDWVLLDIEMQPMDGLTASEQLHASFPTARIVIVTNYDDDLLREAARQAGACGYVLKESLLELRRLLQPGQV
jgi:CheY-like chemotaxis protein